MTRHRDLYITEIGDAYSQEDFRRIRRAIEEFDDRLTDLEGPPPRPMPPVIPLDMGELHLFNINLEENIWYDVYDGPKIPLSVEAIDSSNVKITDAIEIMYTGPAFRMRANQDISNILVLVLTER